MKVTNSKCIFTMFCVGKTQFHVEKNRVHLVSCVCTKVMSIDDVCNYIFKFFTELYVPFTRPCYNIIVVGSTKGLTENEKDWLTSTSPYKGSYSLKNIIISLDDLFGLSRVNFNKVLKHKKVTVGELFPGIDSHETIESFLSHAVFTFVNIQWSNVILIFRMHGIDISGGSITHRHLLSPLNAKMGLLANVIHDGYLLDAYANLHNALSDPWLTSQIPVMLYKNA